MNNNKLISILMPAFNAENTIAESIKSVINQDYKIWELIIINDGSSDSTKQLAVNFTKVDSRIKLINLKSNVGLPGARNIGFENSKGKYITFLDSDDIWLKNKLSSQFDYHQRNRTINISHTGFVNFNNKGIILRPFKFITESMYKKKGNLLPQFLFKNIVGILTVMIDRSILSEVGGFDQNLWGLEDQDLWIRISEKNHKFGYLNKNLAHYRISSQGMMKSLGKYKKAYKVLIHKHNDLIIKNRKLNVSWAVYYNYFGVEYYKIHKYKLSSLYFLKSLRMSDRFLLDITSLLYIVKLIFLKKINNSW
jgi:teichuronic acid biosynthesis glycosyltransferase TuaG